VLVLDAGTNPEEVIRGANPQLLDHQRVRSYSIWTDGPLPRTEGTRKLKRAAIRSWVATGQQPGTTASSEDAVGALLAKFAGSRGVDPNTPIEALGLSSLERVELMVALEDKLQTRVDETRFAEAKTVADLRTLLAESPKQTDVAEPVDFPSWNRRGWINLDLIWTAALTGMGLWLLLVA
jgi:long-chain acyl-CoA synthetase